MATNNKFSDVFKVYPDVEVLYVLDGQPFLSEKDALGLRRDARKEEIEVVRRPKKGKAPAKKKLTKAQREAAEKAAEEAAKKAAEEEE